MILANVRQRLTPRDVELVVHLLARGDAARRAALLRRAEHEGIDVLLDHPELVQRLVSNRSLGSPSAALMLYVFVRHALKSAGADDARLSDYLAALLLEFGMRDRAFRIASHDDAVYRYLTDIVVALETATGRREFLLRAHLGNYSLWLAGVFPDHIVARRERKGGPDLGYYDAMGAQGFRLARDHYLATRFDLADVYDRAAQAFPRLRVALNRLSDRWIFPRRSSPERLVRQVEDQFNILGT